MPNTACSVKAGAVGYTLGAHASLEDGKAVKELLSSVSGICEQVPETSLDPLTALSASGPAYVSCNDMQPSYPLTNDSASWRSRR